MRRPVSDDTGSLAMALLLTMVGVMLAALLVPVVVTQATTSRTDNQRQHSLDAAQAGLDVMMSRIRAAYATSVATGSRKDLPCTLDGTTPTSITEPVASSGSQKYSVTVYYFARDPHGHADWLTDSTKWIRCTTTTGPVVTPAYAVIVSRGTDNPAGTFDSGVRTVQATYVLRVKNTNVPGGLIHNYAADTDLCLDAGSSAPAAGTIVKLQVCSSESAAQQWAYNTNNTISLVSTVDPASSDLGLCLDVPYSTTYPYPHIANSLVKLQKCASSTSRQQQWSYEGGAMKDYIATTYSGAEESYGGSASCLVPITAGPGANLVLGKCRSCNYSTNPATCSDGSDFGDAVFGPEPSVGSGSAIGANGFLVNYAMFGSCMDLTEEQFSYGFLIAYTCRATPDPAAQPVRAQIWTAAVPTGSTKVVTTIKLRDDPDSTRRNYCLTSSFTAKSTPGMTVCNGSTKQTWTVWGDTGNYTTSYRITDSSTGGLCLQPDPTTLYNGVAKIIVATCSGDTLQKWNAPPGVTPLPITDYLER